MKRASYREAVMWIALNDDNGSDGRLDQREVSGMITVGLVADIFGKDAADVAVDVRNARLKNDRIEAEYNAVKKRKVAV